MSVTYPKGIIWRDEAVAAGKERKVGIYYTSTRDFDSVLNFWRKVNFNVFLRISNIPTLVGRAELSLADMELTVIVFNLSDEAMIHMMPLLPSSKDTRFHFESLLCSYVAQRANDFISQTALQFKVKEIK
jgi:hypothetical protein